VRLARRGPDLGRLGQLGLSLAALFVLLHPLLYLRSYYQDRRRTNEPFYRTLDQVRLIRADEPVIVDDREPQRGDPAPGYGWEAHTLGLLLSIADAPHRLVDLSTDAPIDPSQRCRDLLVLLPTREAAANQAIVASLGLQSVGPEASR